KREVAVKVLTARSPGLRGSGLSRLAGEARAAATLNDSHLAHVYGAEFNGPMPFLVMEYIDGPTLWRLLQRERTLPAQLAACIMSDVASGVRTLHGHGIVHRDLKPSNVLLDHTGRAVVSDFGLATSAARPLDDPPAEPRVAGTPSFMAPEMFDGEVSFASDVYALGIITFQLLTGGAPFNGTLEQIRTRHRSAPLPTDALRAAGANDQMIDVIIEATDKSPAARHASAAEFHLAIAPLCADPQDSKRQLAQRIIQISQ
ncbi:MAG TPA: serine/threonine-protein kinase, partial [Tepidisphaeraceae bacterium]|nr:serine/threonine-protein kinase [Tepidisphaeraceae bacterium]